MISGVGGADFCADGVDAEFSFDSGFGGSFKKAKEPRAVLVFGFLTGCFGVGVFDYGISVDCVVDFFVGGVEAAIDEFVFVKFFWLVRWWGVRARWRWEGGFVAFANSEKGERKLSIRRDAIKDSTGYIC